MDGTAPFPRTGEGRPGQEGPSQRPWDPCRDPPSGGTTPRPGDRAQPSPQPEQIPPSVSVGPVAEPQGQTGTLQGRGRASHLWVLLVPAGTPCVWVGPVLPGLPAQIQTLEKAPKSKNKTMLTGSRQGPGASLLISASHGL